MNKLWMTLSVILAIVFGIGTYFGKEAYGNYRRIKAVAAMCPQDLSTEVAILQKKLRVAQSDLKKMRRESAAALKSAIGDIDHWRNQAMANIAERSQSEMDKTKLANDLTLERSSRTQRIAERTAYLQERMDAYRIALGTVLDGAFRESGFRGRYQQFPRTAYPWPTIRYGDLRICFDSGTRRGESHAIVWQQYRLPIEFDQGTVKEVGLPTRDDSASLHCPDISFGFFTFGR